MNPKKGVMPPPMMKGPKKWAQKVELKKGALGPIEDVTVEDMLKDPKTVKRIVYLANVGNIKAKKLLAEFNKRKKNA